MEKFVHVLQLLYYEPLLRTKIILIPDMPHFRNYPWIYPVLRNRLLHCVFYVRVNMILIIENLFFAIFGQKDADDFMITVKKRNQPNWTVLFFKVSFSFYMLVSVIVLINLLIAMMSDTYQSIHSQSDIEWKYGLSKLNRKMQKIRTAAPPFNLVTSWIVYFAKICKRCRIRQRANGVNDFVGRNALSRKSFSRENKIIPMQRNKDSVTFSLLQSSPLGSQLSLKNASKIENVVDWDIVRHKYRVRFGNEKEKPAEDDILTDDI